MADELHALSPEQRARAQALDRARSVLSMGGRGVEATDMVAVAGWIIDGRDPWAKPTIPDELEHRSDG